MDNESSYTPGHPWYYKDHAPLPVDEIIPGEARLYDLPKTRPKLELALIEGEKELQRDIERYLELVRDGDNALCEFERRFDSYNEIKALHSAFALKHNHISYHKGLIKVLKKTLGPEQPALF